MHPGALFTIGSLSVYPYGLCMAIGIILCFVFLLVAFHLKNFNEPATDKLIVIGVVATAIGIVFAMLFQSVYNYIDTGKWSFGSMTFYGGLIGGVGSFLIVWNIYICVIAPRTKIKLLQDDLNGTLTDALPFVPIGITIAHAFGRLGCFFAGCCYGEPTDSWIGMKCASGYNSVLGMRMDNVSVVPVQLMECIFLFILAGVMALLYFKFKFNCNFGVYAVAYGVWRFIIEFFRVDSRGSFIPGLTPSQFWAIIMVLLGIGYFFLYKYVLKNKMRHPELQPPVNPKKAKRAAEDAGEGK